MAHVCSQCLLVLLLLIILSESKAKSSEPVTMSAFKEDDAIVPCFNSAVMDPKSCYRVRLVKYAANGSQIVVFAWPEKKQEVGRVNLTYGKDGQMIVYLTKVKKSDEGLYSCEDCQGWECTQKNISLKVKDCQKSKPVKAAPSTTITLDCPVEKVSGQQGPQKVSWEMLKGGNPVSVNLNRVKTNDTSLVISSVNYSDSGWYRCNYTIGQNLHCFEINLHVQVENVETMTVPVIVTTAQQAPTTSDRVEENSKEKSSGVFIGVVASVITGVVIIAALIGLYFYCRHNTLKVTQQTQRLPAGAGRVPTDGYEIVTLPEDPSVQQINSLYQQYESDRMRTFQR